MNHESSSTHDLRYVKTEELIRDALLGMASERSIDKITVKDLTERARISRKTFYLHYESLPDLLETMQTDIYAGLVSGLESCVFPNDIRTIVHVIFENESHMTSVQRDFCKTAGGYSHQHFADYLATFPWKTHDLGQSSDRGRWQLDIRFFAAAMQCMLRYQKWEGRKRTPSEAAELALRYITQGLSQVVR